MPSLHLPASERPLIWLALQICNTHALTPSAGDVTVKTKTCGTLQSCMRDSIPSATEWDDNA